MLTQAKVAFQSTRLVVLVASEFSREYVVEKEVNQRSWIHQSHRGQAALAEIRKQFCCCWPFGSRTSPLAGSASSFQVWFSELIHMNAYTYIYYIILRVENERIPKCPLNLTAHASILAVLLSFSADLSQARLTYRLLHSKTVYKQTSTALIRYLFFLSSAANNVYCRQNDFSSLFLYR